VTDRRHESGATRHVGYEPSREAVHIAKRIGLAVVVLGMLSTLGGCSRPAVSTADRISGPGWSQTTDAGVVFTLRVSPAQASADETITVSVAYRNVSGRTVRFPNSGVRVVWGNGSKVSSGSPGTPQGQVYLRYLTAALLRPGESHEQTQALAPRVAGTYSAVAMTESDPLLKTLPVQIVVTP
jgi:hypothetical protein